MVRFEIVVANSRSVVARFTSEDGSKTDTREFRAEEFIDASGNPSRPRLMQACIHQAKMFNDQWSVKPDMRSEMTTLVGMTGDSNIDYLTIPERAKVVSSDAAAKVV